MTSKVRVRVQCQDKYEAQKLASIIYLREKGETFLDAIIGVYDTEIVLSLKDKSAHSVMMASVSHVESFVDFAQSIVDGRGQMLGVSTFGSQVELLKSNQ
ncbi:MAG: hypothetical protein K8823_456 [Cenarchaeum symbiont of Oopsacas minuta]|nr:hypothetical protein [Cenarchaeum symbiont of Oopsacas minuta]